MGPDQCEPNFKKPKQSKDIPAKTRAAVKRRSGGVCEAREKLPEICNGRAAQIDHIMNRSQERNHDLDNLQHLCNPCHDWKTTHPNDAETLGLYVRAGLGSLPFDDV